MYKKKSLFVTFEGIEGSGKSYQCRKLYKNLKKRRIPVLLTREPGGTSGAEKIREVILDDYFKNSNTRVDFIKIDVECSELKVLTGLKKTLKNNDNLKILIEYSYPCREAFNIEPNDNMKFLSEYGFHFSDATYKDATVFFDYDYLVSKYTNSWINFLCVKK